MIRKWRKWLLAICCIIGVIVLAGVVSLALLDEEWLKGRLEKIAREKLEGQLTIATLSFSPWSGKASADGVRFVRQEPNSDLEAKTDSLKLHVRVWPLLWRSVQIERLEMDKPSLKVVVRRQADTGGDTVDKIKSYIRSKGGIVRIELPPEGGLVVSQLVMRDGTVDYLVTRPGAPDFRAGVSELNYSASDVTMNTFYRLVVGADIECRIRMGDAQARLQKRVEAGKSTLSLTGVDLGYCDRYFNQADALVVAGGTMDVSTSKEPDKKQSSVDIKLTGLKLASNPKADRQEFLFIPLDRLIRYAQSKDGNLSLKVVSDFGAHDMSADLDYFVQEFWKGMWIAIVKEVSPDSIKDILQGTSTSAQQEDAK